MKSASHDELPAPENATATLALSFPCPDCQATCWVRWDKLGEVHACPACRKRFQIGRGGRLEAATEIELLHFLCPRCQGPGTIPAAAVRRGARCKSCHMDLLPGPDHQLHTADELKEVRRQCREEHEAGAREPAARHVWWIVMAASLVALGVLGWIVSTSLATGPADLARTLTARGLGDEWEAAEEFVREERRPEFRKWCILQFASLRNRYRPRGDTATITAEALEERDDYVLFRIHIESAYLGHRRHHQGWVLAAGRWTLDPADSLRAEQRFAPTAE